MPVVRTPSGDMEFYRASDATQDRYKLAERGLRVPGGGYVVLPGSVNVDSTLERGLFLTDGNYIVLPGSVNADDQRYPLPVTTRLFTT